MTRVVEVDREQLEALLGLLVEGEPTAVGAGREWKALRYLSLR